MNKGILFFSLFVAVALVVSGCANVTEPQNSKAPGLPVRCTGDVTCCSDTGCEIIPCYKGSGPGLKCVATCSPGFTFGDSNCATTYPEGASEVER